MESLNRVIRGVALGALLVTGSHFGPLTSSADLVIARESAASVAGCAVDAAGDLVVVTTTGNAQGARVTVAEVRHCERITNAEAGPDESVSEVIIEFHDMYFAPNELTIPANTNVTIRLINRGLATHNVALPSANLRSATVGAGEEAVFTVNLAPGSYSLICTIPGHRNAGMTGTLRVES